MHAAPQISAIAVAELTYNFYNDGRVDTGGASLRRVSKGLLCCKQCHQRGASFQPVECA